MNDYDAKQAYQNSAEATTYDTKRFKNLRGRIGNALDRRTLLKALAALSQSQSGFIKILDMPCGTGRMTHFLLEQGHYVVGADVSREMMRVARTKIIEGNTFGGFHQSDAAALCFKDDSFDCVVSVRFMGHIPKDARIKILAEFHRISRYAVIEYSIKSRVAMLRRQVDHYLGTGLPLPQRWPWHIFERQELYSELEEAGFRVINKWPKMYHLSDSWYVLLQRDDSQQ